MGGWDSDNYQTTLCPRPEALTEPTTDDVAVRDAPSPRVDSFPTSFHSGDFFRRACRISRVSLGPTPGPPLLSRLTFRSPLYIVCASFSPGRPQNLSPEFLQCPRPWLALSVTLSRARAAGLHPSFQPRSNRSPPCGRCRVAASTVLRCSPQRASKRARK